MSMNNEQVTVQLDYDYNWYVVLEVSAS